MSTPFYRAAQPLLFVMFIRARIADRETEASLTRLKTPAVPSLPGGFLVLCGVSALDATGQIHKTPLRAVRNSHCIPARLGESGRSERAIFMICHRYFRVVFSTLLLIPLWPAADSHAAKPGDKSDRAEEAEKIDPADAAYRRAQAAYESEDFDQAIRIFDEVIRLDPTYVQAYVSRGMAWNEKSEPDQALKDFNGAIPGDPRFAPAFFHRGMTWNARKEYDKAIKDFNAALALDPEDDAALFNRGVAWSQKGDHDRAIRDFDASIKLDDTFAPAFVLRGDALASKRQFEKALQDYDAAIRIDPKYGTGLNGKAWILATCPDKKFRDGKKAVVLATMACEQTKYKEAGFLETLSCAQAEAGHFDEAVKWQTKALSDPEFARQAGPDARAKLELFEQNKPFRDDQ
jgi:tetratricopeptide (TPR) repeat protein